MTIVFTKLTQTVSPEPTVSKKTMALPEPALAIPRLSSHERETDPDDVAVPTPLSIIMDPPTALALAPLPPETVIDPPLVLPSPGACANAPPAPRLEDPVLKDAAPPLPAADEPAVRLILPPSAPDDEAPTTAKLPPTVSHSNGITRTNHDRNIAAGARAR